MAVLEVQIDDKGEIGALPEALQKFFDKRINEAFGKGAEKAGKESQGQLEAAVAKARDEAAAAAKAGQLTEAEREKLKNLERELSLKNEAEATKAKDYEAASKLREERFANERAEIEKKAAEERQQLADKIAKREGRIRDLIATDIKIEAQRNGAREDSLRLIGKDLNDFVGMGEDLLPVVNAAKFVKEFAQSKLGQDGKPVTIEGLVQEYLSLHPVHKAPVKGVGGRATGGFSQSGQVAKTGVDAEKADAIEDLSKNPSSVTNIARALSMAGKSA